MLCKFFSFLVFGGFASRKIQEKAKTKKITLFQTHHFLVIREVSLFDEGEVLLAHFLLNSEHIREDPRFILLKRRVTG